MLLLLLSLLEVAEDPLAVALSVIGGTAKAPMVANPPKVVLLAASWPIVGLFLAMGNDAAAAAAGLPPSTVLSSMTA